MPDTSAVATPLGYPGAKPGMQNQGWHQKQQKKGNNRTNPPSSSLLRSVVIKKTSSSIINEETSDQRKRDKEDRGLKGPKDEKVKKVMRKRYE